MAIQFNNTGTGVVTLSSPSSGTVNLTLPSADGTTGQVLQTNGSGVLSFGTASGLPGSQGQTFTSSGTFTIPSGVTAIKMTVVGGGGNGGSGFNGSGFSAGSGGGGGGTAIKYLTGLTPGNTLTVTVGAATGTSSVASGTQSITTVSATGGVSGAFSPGGTLIGGVGGLGSNGDINIGGNPGGPVLVVGCGPTPVATMGGGSTLGGGGQPITGASSVAGNPGRGPGGGASGSWQTGSVASGAGGVVLIEW